ncbi:MAG: HAD-IA family hydrolase [Actinomycetota bacterium]
MTALLIGSISTLADTSERQRAAFNAAFADHGLDWHWGRDDYRSMLDVAGGQDRVTAFAAARGENVDAGAVHATKSERFRADLAENGVEPRPGIVETIAARRADGDRVALVTTTSRDNVDALLAALGGLVTDDDFDVVLTSEDVDDPKPDPAVYHAALERLGVSADQAVAVEDNVDGARSASAAGVFCVAFPNANTADHDFSSVADRVVVDRLDPSLAA